MTPPTLATIRQFLSNNRWLVAAFTVAVVTALIQFALPDYPFPEDRLIFYPLLYVRHAAVQIALNIFLLVATVLAFRKMQSGSCLYELLTVSMLFLSCSLPILTCGLVAVRGDFNHVESIRHDGHVYRIIYAGGWSEEDTYSELLYTIFECDWTGLVCHTIDNYVSSYLADEEPRHPHFEVSPSDTLIVRIGGFPHPIQHILDN
jgi:hypothetical protein